MQRAVPCVENMAVGAQHYDKTVQGLEHQVAALYKQISTEIGESWVNVT